LFMISRMRVLKIFGDGYDYRLGFRWMWCG
jgi:hypothetical protein